MQTSSPLLPEPARRVAAWCVVLLLAAAVAAVGIWLCVVFETVVTPVLLAILGTALLGPLYRRLLQLKVRKSFAAALTVVAVLAVVGGATYIVVAALIETGDQIIASLRQAADDIAEHLGPAGTSSTTSPRTPRGSSGSSAEPPRPACSRASASSAGCSPPPPSPWC